MQDAYESSLWDINPTCQVAAICDNDTVVLDGAFGASIRWKSFYPVWYNRGESWKRIIATKIIEYNTYFIAFASYLFSTNVMELIVLGVIFLFTWLYFWFMTPKLVRITYGGKFTDVQATFFGVEGYLNAATIERAIFGGVFGRMSWSTCGSPLSRTYVNANGERVGLDPSKDPEIRMKIEAAKTAKPGEPRVSCIRRKILISWC
jgi:hypothetical protein